MSLGIIGVFHVAVGWIGGQIFTGFAFLLHGCLDLLAAVLYIELIDDVQERRKVVIHLIGTVHTAIDGNEPDIVLREKDLRTETYFQIVSSDSAHAHGKKNTDLVCFYHGDHALPFRTVEVGTGKTVVHEKLDFAETLFFCVFLENRLLIDNAVALSCLLVITTQAAIDTPLLYMAWE